MTTDRHRPRRRVVRAVSLAAAAVAIGAGALAPTAAAMGSGDSYEDLQVGASSTISMCSSWEAASSSRAARNTRGERHNPPRLGFPKPT